MDEVNYPHALIVCGYDPVFKSLHVDLFGNNGILHQINISSTLFIRKFMIFSTYNIIINNFVIILSCCNNDGLPVNHIFGGYCLMSGQWSMFIM